MIPKRLEVAPLTATAFAPYGDVIASGGTPDKMINEGMCGRYHDRAVLDFTDGRAGLSLFDAQERQLPLAINMVERHAKGSQAFIPISHTRYITIVAGDEGGRPVSLRAFLADYEQSVNLHRGVWHGALTPVGASGRFMVVDRIGDGANLEEHWFDTPYIIETID